jgi:hypothetical protein
MRAIARCRPLGWQFSMLCKDNNEHAGAFLDRPLEGRWPYL